MHQGRLLGTLCHIVLPKTASTYVHEGWSTKTTAGVHGANEEKAYEGVTAVRQRVAKRRRLVKHLVGEVGRAKNQSMEDDSHLLSCLPGFYWLMHFDVCSYSIRYKFDQEPCIPKTSIMISGNKCCVGLFCVRQSCSPESLLHATPKRFVFTASSTC